MLGDASLQESTRTARRDQLSRAPLAIDVRGVEKTFQAVVRVDTPQEVEYFRNGGILPYVLRQLAAGGATA